MQTLRIFLYDQVLRLQVREGQLLYLEDRAVYARTMTVHKGIDNTIRLFVKNAEQKYVDLADLTFYVELVTKPGGDFIDSFTATVENTLGRARFVIPASTLNPLIAGWYHLLVKYDDGNGNLTPAYSDDNYGVAIPVYVNDGYRVSGDVYQRGEDLDLGSIPELIDENRDLGAF